MVQKTSYILIATLLHGAVVLGLSILAGPWTSPENELQLTVTVGQAPQHLSLRAPEEKREIIFEEPEPSLSERDESFDDIFQKDVLNLPLEKKSPSSKPDLFRPLKPSDVPQVIIEKPGAVKEERAAVEVFTPPPEYPRIAHRRGYEGVSVVQFQIALEGHCEEIKIAESSGYSILDEAAIATVKKWRFQPAFSDGHNIVSNRRVRFVFKLTK